MSEAYSDAAMRDATSAPALRAVPSLPPPLGDGLFADDGCFDQEVVCRRVVRVTHDTVTIVLEPTRPGPLTFLPGQYLTLTAEVDGRQVERCYTISSPPTRPHLLTVTVKHVPGGGLTPFLHERLRPGDRLTARGPLGGFSAAAHPAHSYLLLSAGSGITPTLSMLRTVSDLAEALDIVVVHHARTPADLVCRAEVDALTEAHGSIRVVWVCEEDAAPVHGLPEWSGARGRVDAEQLRSMVPDLADREVLTCGPPGYMTAVREALTVLGADPRRCHEESFVLGTASAPELATPEGPGSVPATDPASGPPADAEPAGPRIRFARSAREVVCPPGTTVLEAAADAGIVLPSSCEEGLCGTCTSTLLSGSVDMRHQGGIRPRQIAAQMFLPCCSTPEGDIVVDA